MLLIEEYGMQWFPDKIHRVWVDEVQKNDQTDIIVRIDDFGGKPGLTIREFTTSERYTGFTKSGTRIAAEKFEEFKKLINSISQSDFPEPSEATVESGAPKKAQASLPSEESQEDY